MKKLAFVILAIFLAGNVFAQGVFAPITVSMQKGWNLVPGLNYSSGTNTCGTNPNSKISAAWWYSPKISQGGGEKINYSSRLGEMADISTQIKTESATQYYAAIPAYFMYAQEPCQIQLSWSQTPFFNLSLAKNDELNRLEFAKGWNFVAIIPQMAGQKMKDLFSNCRLGPKSYLWSTTYYGIGSGKGKWVDSPLSDPTMNLPIQENGVGEVILLKFQDDCTLHLPTGFAASTDPMSPPAMPE